MCAISQYLKLLDSYTRERLYTIHPKDGTNIVPFEELVQAPKKIVNVKENSNKSFSGSASHNQIHLVKYKKQ